MKINACVLGLLLALCAAGCVKPDFTPPFTGEASSLQDCLAMLENTIKRDTGQARPVSVWETFTNNPTRVDGWVWGSEKDGFFSCELRQTEAQGTYWRAYVVIPDRLRTNAD